MANGRTRPASKGTLRRLFSLFGKERGNVAALFGILLVPLVGAIAVGTEVAGWIVEHRAEQNGADSAAIAAAAEGGDGTGQFQNVGLDVAHQYGFVNGADSVTVQIQQLAIGKGSALASVCALGCYQATITKTMPITLASVVGYTGTGKGTQQITASAIAASVAVQGPFCVVAMGTGGKHGTGITIDGGGSSPSNLTCNAFSIGDLTCNGSHAQVTLGVANTEGKIKGTCGDQNQFSGQSPPANINPFAADQSFVPADSCGSTSFPMNFTSPGGSWSAGNNQLATVDPNWDGGTQVFCGDVDIKGTVTLSSSTPTTIVIENGNLNLESGAEIQTTGTGGVTIVFAGSGSYSCSNCGVPTNFFSGGGSLDIAASSSGNWDGVAIYQSNTLPIQSTNFSGSSPSTIDISGALVATQADLAVNGDIGRASAGKSCFTLFVDSLSISGNAFVLTFPGGAQSQCKQTQQVFAQTGVTGKLVQ